MNIINIALLITLLLLNSCKHKEIKNCGCGLIIEKYKSFNSIKVRNHCTHNDTLIYLDKNTYKLIDEDRNDEYCLYKNW